VAAAAQTYFGVPVSKLTIAQDAVIAAIIQQPANYPSLQYRPELEYRWRNSVLDGLVTMGDLTPAQAAAMKFPKLLTDSPNYSIDQQYGIANPSDTWAPYVMNVVARELQDDENNYTEAQLETGGYKIVTSISRPMEQELYKAVDSNLAQMASQGGALPSYALVGAELQNPNNGQIIAMYPGIGQVGVSAKECALKDCQLNTAVDAREQVGSSFKPYVLSEAVIQGMNVKTSILDGYGPEAWIPPDTMPTTFSTNNKNQASAEWFPVTNDGNANYGPMSVQNAFAQSSNVAFTDLIHRVGTVPVINLAQDFGVNISPYAQGGSGLDDDGGEVGVALGIASISVNEQDTMLATIDNGGTYHEAHLVVSVTAPDQNPVAGKYKVHEVLTANQAAEVQWAMSTVVTQGTAAGNIDIAAGDNPREVIGKTGTTNNAQSAFFIGAIPQYALSVGIWTENQSSNTTQTLNGLGGSANGGYGGAWPASIWNTFANAEFAQLPVDNYTQPVFTGNKWVQVQQQPKKKAKPKPSSTPTCRPDQPFCRGRGGGLPTSPVTAPPTSSGPTTCTNPVLCSTPTPTASITAPASPTPTATPTQHPFTTDATTAVQSGLAIGGGVISVVPGSLLWTTASRRRRRRAREKLATETAEV
jgi:membrane peptidoglycan carboxypeptidase